MNVNDLPGLDTITKQYEYVCREYQSMAKIEADSDGSLLQAYLQGLEEWSEHWQLKFDPDKCEDIHIGHKFRMSDNGVDKFLEDVSEEKDLEVFVTSDLKPNTAAK